MSEAFSPHKKQLSATELLDIIWKIPVFSAAVET